MIERGLQEYQLPEVYLDMMTCRGMNGALGLIHAFTFRPRLIMIYDNLVGIKGAAVAKCVKQDSELQDTIMIGLTAGGDFAGSGAAFVDQTLRLPFLAPAIFRIVQSYLSA
jgi:hypothetical protein